jgi:hypothetical protein
MMAQSKRAEEWGQLRAINLLEQLLIDWLRRAPRCRTANAGWMRCCNACPISAVPAAKSVTVMSIISNWHAKSA